MNAENNEQTEILRSIWNEMKAMNANLSGRIDGLANSVDGLGAKMDQMRVDLSARIDQTNSRIDETNVRLDQTNARLFLLEGVVRDVAGQQIILGRYVKNTTRDLQHRVTRLETRFPEPEEGQRSQTTRTWD